MLDELDAIPWRALRHALGDASNVPRLLRMLTADDHDERQAALKQLFACLLHQGAVYEATPYALPFLFELLAQEATPDKSWVAFLIASIADGQGYLSAHSAGNEQRWRQLLAERGTTLEAELRIEDEIVHGVETEVGRQLQLLIPFLNDGQSEIRAAVARALGRQTSQARALLAPLLAAEARETASDARDALHRSLTKLRSHVRD